MSPRATSMVVTGAAVLAICPGPATATVDRGEIRPGYYRGESEQGLKVEFQLEVDLEGRRPLAISPRVRARDCGSYRVDAHAPVDERSHFEAHDGTVDLYAHFVTRRKARGEFFIYDESSGCDTGATHFKAKQRRN